MQLVYKLCKLIKLRILIYVISMNEFVQMSMNLNYIMIFKMIMMSMDDIFIVKYYWKFQAMNNEIFQLNIK